MKKIGVYYIGIIVCLILACAVIVMKSGYNKGGKLPDEISVYYKEENKTELVNFEEFLTYVVAAEVPASFNEEAIKAQAVAARTYIYSKYVKYKDNPQLIPEEHNGAVVCTDSTHCCAYAGMEALQKTHGEQWVRVYYKKIVDCVEKTKGEFITYDGAPITAAFHASSGGGRTENSRDVWANELPYLVSVVSSDEDTRDGYISKKEISCDDFKKLINEKYPEAKLDDDRNKWFGELTRTEGNAVKSIKIGNAVVSGIQLRSLFSLKSACFDISMLDDKITFTVQGSGHGVGMSQHGANLMAEKGKSYDEILKWYYTGVEIEK